MNETEISKLFPGSNFMTPDIIKYGEAGEYVYELSCGSGISGGRIWGLTVHYKDGSDTELSSCYHNYQSALDAIEELTHGVQV